MPGEAHDFSPTDLLELRVREDFLEHGGRNVVGILRGLDLTNDFKGSILEAALQNKMLDVVRFIFEEAKIDLSPEQSMLFLLKASKEQQQDIAVYLTERNFANEVVRADAYALLFEHFKEDAHEKLADAVAAQTPDKKDALDSMLLAAASEKKFGVLSHLLDKGADPNVSNAAVLTKIVVNAPKDFYDKKEDYLKLAGKFIDSGLHNNAALDKMLAVAAGLAATGLQYPETAGLLLERGADPWFNHRHAETQWQEKGFKPESLPPETFEAARGNITRHARFLFDTIFKQDFRIADLRQQVNEDGDTGFTLAARARVLERVLQRALDEGTNGLKPADLFATNRWQQSLLSLAIDRDDAKAILQPAYWQKADPDVVQQLEQRLSEAQKQYLDLQGLTSGVNQQQLKQGARRYRLAPG